MIPCFDLNENVRFLRNIFLLDCHIQQLIAIKVFGTEQAVCTIKMVSSLSFMDMLFLSEMCNEKILE